MTPPNKKQLFLTPTLIPMTISPTSVPSQILIGKKVYWQGDVCQLTCLVCASSTGSNSQVACIKKTLGQYQGFLQLTNIKINKQNLRE